MTSITISKTEDQGKGRYEAYIENTTGAGEITYSRISRNLIIADRTFVPSSLRGLGVARALVTVFIADARLRGERIVPLCLHLRAYAASHFEELSDVIQW